MIKNTNLNLVTFIALMGSSALALASKLIFNNILTDVFSYVIEISVIALFLFYLPLFVIHIKKKEFSENLKNPMKSNLYSSIPITAALISIMLIQIGIPYFKPESNTIISVAFWFISLLLSLVLIILIPINLKFRSKPCQVFGTWFIPPVGLFVLITAGSLLALNFPLISNFVILINLLLFGPAFILYFLTLNLLYSRSKFYELEETKTAPTFNIVLAPVGVSILAMLSTSKALIKYEFLELGNLFSGVSKIYSLIMFGYGLWVLLGLFFLYYRIVKEKGKIPLSELWWAFVFPIGAFTLASVNIYSFTNLIFIKIVYLIMYFYLLTLWLYIFSKQILLYFKNKSKTHS